MLPYIRLFRMESSIPPLKLLVFFPFQVFVREVLDRQELIARQYVRCNVESGDQIGTDIRGFSLRSVGCFQRQVDNHPNWRMKFSSLTFHLIPADRTGLKRLFVFCPNLLDASCLKLKDSVYLLA